MNVIISGGGTGGHIYPALAIIQAIKDRYPETKILYVGAEDRLESQLVPENGIDFVGLKIKGISRKNPFTNVKTFTLFQQAIKKSNKLIEDFKPDVVIGTGGYASSAVLYAAQKKKIPTIINEQNLYPGVTNKLLAKKAKVIAISFADSKMHFAKKLQSKVVLTGNPRGQQVYKTKSDYKLSEIGLKNNKSTVLIFGGSLGAYRINKAVLDSINRYADEKEFQTIFVTGKKYFESVQIQLEEEKISQKNIAVLPYVDNMDELLHEIDLIVSRSGATTLAEITALGLPSILIPSPNVTGNQQELNAKSLVSKKAARMILEPELTGDKLFHDIKKLITNKPKLIEISANSKEIGIDNAADLIVDQIEKIIKK
jgi:UDP-N-acetylglucosamine--N-acetylmuramyl-(pentapeptide) pyrophosphoryl-undecaprenol N-acetylglucosamine transferase